MSSSVSPSSEQGLVWVGSGEQILAGRGCGTFDSILIKGQTGYQLSDDEARIGERMCKYIEICLTKAVVHFIIGCF